MFNANIDINAATPQFGDVPGASIPATAAVDFLKRLDAFGRHNLVAIDPETGRPTGRTFEPGQWQAIERYVAEWNGKANLYFTVNEPKAGAPDKKLGKRDISNIRALYADSDPKAGQPFEEERKRLLEMAMSSKWGECPPSWILDSGGGVQLFWALESKLPAAEFELQAEEQGRGLAHVFGGDPVQNSDRLMRLPGTLNIPNALKLSKGRKEALARVLYAGTETYSLERLAAWAPPRKQTQSDKDSDIRIQQAMERLDYGAVTALIDYDDLPSDLRERFEKVRRSNPQLEQLWRDGESSALIGDDMSGSGYRMSLATYLGRAGGFNEQDFGALLWVWDYAVQDESDRDTKIVPRTICRDWIRFGWANSVERWFEPVQDYEPLFPEEAVGAADAIAKREPLKWIDPTIWEGKAIPERQWEVENWIPRHEVTTLYGDGGTGKTLLIHLYATCAATGRDWLGQKTRPARVMCFFCEDGEDELHRRQNDINAALGISFHDLGRLRLLSRKYADNLLALWDQNTGAMKLQAVWEQLLADALAFKADVIVVDTLADTYGGNEVNRAQVNTFVKSCLGRLAQEIGGSVIALGHPSLSGKASGQGTSGSTAWSNAVRSRLFLRYPKGTDKGNIRELEGMKLNYGPKGSLLKLRWNRGVFEVLAGTKPAQADTGTPAASIASIEDAAGDAVVSVLLSHPGERLELDKPNSAYFAPKVLKRIEPEALAAFSHDEVETAMRKLETLGIIRHEMVGRDSSHRKLYGFVVVPDKLSNSEPSASSLFD